MLRITRRHERDCTLRGHESAHCPKKINKCPVWIAGTGPDGIKVKESLDTRDWAVASAKLHDREAGIKPERAAVTIADACAQYLRTKPHVGDESTYRYRAHVERFEAFMTARGIRTIQAVELSDLDQYKASWTGAPSTRQQTQNLLRGFFKFWSKRRYCENLALDLDPIKQTRAKTDPLTPDEIKRIMAALPAADPQTRAFVLLLRTTGMAIGDVVKLEDSMIDGAHIVTNRKKTGEDVSVTVPQAVIDAYRAAPRDSERFCFWSGNGKLHSRVSKWCGWLRLFLDGIGLQHRDGYSFRHAYARDFLEGGGSMEELSELLGNTLEMCIKHYSKWDKTRQDRLKVNSARIWAARAKEFASLTPPAPSGAREPA
jgi:site-specific recombinase XerD